MTRNRPHRSEDTRRDLDAAIVALDVNDSAAAVRCWESVAAREADGSRDALFARGMLAEFRDGDSATSLELLTAAADAGSELAMFRIGVVLLDAGLADGARMWWQRAADAGDVGAAVNLGVLCHAEGDVEGARRWWREAAKATHPEGRAKLAVLAAEAGARETAREIWLGVVAELPHGESFFNLGLLAWEDGDPSGALDWWRSAEASGIEIPKELDAAAVAALQARGGRSRPEMD